MMEQHVSGMPIPEQSNEYCLLKGRYGMLHIVQMANELLPAATKEMRAFGTFAQEKKYKNSICLKVGSGEQRLVPMDSILLR
jgi:hypothetical protein